MGKTRERIVDASAELFRRQGYIGTGMKQIVAAADAPFGSLYHFFPGGKEQLGAEVIRHAGRYYEELVMGIWDAAPDLTSAIDAVFSGAAEVLRQTDYADACPIATIALEVASTNEPLREATADVFESWFVQGAARLEAAGIKRADARDLIVALLSLLEGAFLFGRATRDAVHVERAGQAAAALVRDALGRVNGSPGRAGRTRRRPTPPRRTR
ncbi:MAG TPA: TetR/AcrR family transcriptional regulator [Acidimicrobiales bacterium]|nr:TetR/AcrR family transcriptional regulator [Acidimicrobiales bacterium]